MPALRPETLRRAAFWAPPLAAALVAANTLPGGFTFDDAAVVRGNELLARGDLAGLLTTPYWGQEGKDPLHRPVTMLSFALDRAIAGPGPAGFHAGNVLLHALASLLAAALALRLLRRPGPALLAGLLFAVHPLRTEAVAGIVGRAEILAAIFSFLVILLSRAESPLARLGLAPFALLLALFSKESAVAALPLALLCEAFFPSGRRGAPRFAVLLLPLALFAAVRLALFGTLLRSGPNPVWGDLGDGARLLTAVKILGLYLRLFLWPHPLSPDYSWEAIPAARSALEPGVAAALAALLALVAIPALLRWREGLFGSLFLLVALGPVANVFFGIGTVAAERLLYLPAWGAGLLVALAAEAAARRHRAPAVGLSAALLLAAAARTMTRNLDWRDDTALFREAARTTPRSFVVRLKWGMELDRLGRVAAAEANLEEALRIRPGCVEALNALGRIRERAGRLREAEALFAEAVRLRPEDPIPRKNLGALLIGMGRLPEAARHLEEAVRLRPAFADAWSDLGAARARSGDLSGAREAFDAALRLRPDHAVALRGRAGCRRAAGDDAGAEADLRAALGADPADATAHHHLGDLLLRSGRAREALAHLRAALAGGPAFAGAHLLLGRACEEVGERREAADHLRAFLETFPSAPEAGEARERLARLQGR